MYKRRGRCIVGSRKRGNGVKRRGKGDKWKKKVQIERMLKRKRKRGKERKDRKSCGCPLKEK